MPSAKEMIRATIGTADSMFQGFVGDLSEDDLLMVPVEGMNPIAWQIGHLIVAHRGWVDAMKPGSCAPLPEGFEEAHSKATAAPAPFQKVATKAEYLAAWSALSAATDAVLDGLTDEELDAPSGKSYAPTNAALLTMIGVHIAEHAGQFVAVRRKTGKSIVM